MPRFISPDALLLDEEGHYHWTPDRAKEVWEKSYQDLQETLKNPAVSKLVLMVGPPGAGKSTWLKDQAEAGNLDNHAIYFDATLTKKGRRSILIGFAQAAGVPVEAVVFLTPIPVMLQRNAAREKNRQVPWDTMSSMIENMKAQPVTADEGVVEIHVIRS